MDPTLIEAYKRTRYVVDTSGGQVVIRVGQPAPDIDGLLDAYDASCWGYVTAYNPGSKRVADRVNRARQAEFVEQLRAAGYVLFAGRGEPAGPDAGGWEAEQSVLVVGLSREDAIGWAAKFGQNALIWAGRGDAAQLVWCDH